MSGQIYYLISFGQEVEGFRRKLKRPRASYHQQELDGTPQLLFA